MLISQAALFGFAAYENYAPWPVWSDSTPKPVRFEPVPKKEAHRRYWMARQFDRVTKIGGGCQGGAVGTPALKVLEALTFDFLNYASGRLDPGYKALAKAANISVSAVHTALRRLRDLGILVWQRRCDEGWSGGRYLPPAGDERLQHPPVLRVARVRPAEGGSAPGARDMGQARIHAEHHRRRGCGG